MKKALKESHGEEIEYHEAQVRGINATLERIRQRLKAMYEDRLDGRITPDFYDERVKGFTEEQELLTDSLKKLNSNSAEYYKIGLSIHELALKAKDIYLSEKASVEERRALLAYAFETVSVLKGIVSPQYTKAFGFLATWMPKVNQILEPAKQSSQILISEGNLQSFTPEFSLELFELQSNSRTKKDPVLQGLSGSKQPKSDSLLRTWDDVRLELLNSI